MTDNAKKTSVFGFLKNIVAEDVPDRPTRNTPLPAAPHVVERHAFDPSVGLVKSMGPDPQALSKLEARLQSACPAPYAAFMEQYESLKEDIADERTRFKVALKTTHTTADVVIEALDHLLDTMSKAKDEFTHSFDENKNKKMTSAQEAITAGEQLIASSEEQIKAIQEKIVSLKQKRETDIQNMQDEGRRLDAILGGFSAAHTQVVHRLEDQKNRISSMPKV